MTGPGVELNRMSVQRQGPNGFQELAEDAEHDLEQSLLEDLTVEDQEMRLSTSRSVGLSVEVRSSRVQQSLAQRTKNTSGDVVARKWLHLKFYNFVFAVLAFVATMMWSLFDRWSQAEHAFCASVLTTLALMNLFFQFSLWVELLMLNRKAGGGLKSRAKSALPPMHPVEVIVEGSATVVSGYDVVEGDLMVLREGDVLVADGLVVKSKNLTVTRESGGVSDRFTVEKSDVNGIILPAGTAIESGHGRALAVRPPQMNLWEEEAQEAIHEDFAQFTPKQLEKRHIIRGFLLFHVAAFATVGGFLDEAWMSIMGTLIMMIGWIVYVGARLLHAFLVWRIGAGIAALGLTEEILFRFKHVGVLMTPSSNILTTGALTALATWTWGSSKENAQEPKPWSGSFGQDYAEHLMHNACTLASGHSRSVGARESVTHAFVNPTLGTDIGLALSRMVGERASVTAPFRILRDSRVHGNDAETTAYGGERFFWSITQPTNAQEGPSPLVVYAVGSARAMIGQCTHILEGGDRTPLENHHVNHISEAFLKTEGRMIGFAVGYLDSLPREDYEPSDLCFIGYCVLGDSLVDGAAAAIGKFQSVSKRIILSTEDSVNSIVADARKVGMIDSFPSPYTPLEHATTSSQPKCVYITGTQISTMTAADWDFLSTCDADVILSEVSGGQKCIVAAEFQKRGYAVAAVGSDVNETGLLLRADVGIATGTQGTAVARASADIVLLDDSIAALGNILDLAMRDFTIGAIRVLKWVL